MGGRWRLAGAAVLSAFLAVAGCGGSVLLVADSIPSGTWGGDHASLSVGAGVSTVQLDCAHGTLGSRIPIDRTGRFDVSGVFVREHGGPVPVGGSEDSHAARFFGSIVGGQLTLFISVTDLDLSLGPFTLVLGQSPRLVRCV